VIFNIDLDQYRPRTLQQGWKKVSVLGKVDDLGDIWHGSTEICLKILHFAQSNAFLVRMLVQQFRLDMTEFEKRSRDRKIFIL